MDVTDTEESTERFLAVCDLGSSFQDEPNSQHQWRVSLSANVQKVAGAVHMSHVCIWVPGMGKHPKSQETQ